MQCKLLKSLVKLLIFKTSFIVFYETHFLCGKVVKFITK